MKTNTTITRAIGGTAIAAAVLTAGVAAPRAIEQFNSGYNTSTSTVSSLDEETTETSAWLGPMGFWLRCYIPRCGLGKVVYA
ncbi:hypothetical protein GS894_24135 [Rhodococcus hoagii]|nr:hypothetical protein [Prescottella equi]NKR90477.1 hypothetical protein [Prescottella equi]NKS05214.1 hypothetical protein [Prescottella equi]NKS86977.1 hypothetical protein [Prescottella equi]NKS87007.1 hypothetical protein [Prescottella equi]